MARDPLKVLLAVRRHAIDRQRQDLAACLMTEAAAANRIHALDAAMARDQALAAASPDPSRFHDIFIATRRHLRAERQGTETALAAAERACDEARGRLAKARLEAEAVERLIAERADIARAGADRRAQYVLDDISRGLRK